MSKVHQIERDEQSAEHNEPQEQLPVVTTTVSVGALSRALIKKAHEAGKPVTNEAIAAKVVEMFKSHGMVVKTSAASIAWYKNDMRKKGQLPKGASGSKGISINLDELVL